MAEYESKSIEKNNICFCTSSLCRRSILIHHWGMGTKDRMKNSSNNATVLQIDLFIALLCWWKYPLKSWHKTSKDAVWISHFPVAGALRNSNMPPPSVKHYLQPAVLHHSSPVPFNLPHFKLSSGQIQDSIRVLWGSPVAPHTSRLLTLGCVGGYLITQMGSLEVKLVCLSRLYTYPSCHFKLM